MRGGGERQRSAVCGGRAPVGQSGFRQSVGTTGRHDFAGGGLGLLWRMTKQSCVNGCEWDRSLIATRVYLNHRRSCSPPRASCESSWCARASRPRRSSTSPWPAWGSAQRTPAPGHETVTVEVSRGTPQAARDLARAATGRDDCGDRRRVEGGTAAHVQALRRMQALSAGGPAHDGHLVRVAAFGPLLR